MKDYKIKEAVSNLQQDVKNLKKAFEDMLMGFEAMVDILSEKFDEKEPTEDAGV